MNANTNLTVVGVDLAKNVFQLHFVDEETSEVKRLKLSRQKFQQFFVNRAPCLIGMEACGGSHYWAREFLKLGHQVKVMPVSGVKAFNSGNKSDARDAQAIWADQSNSRTSHRIWISCANRIQSPSGRTPENAGRS